MRAMGVENSDVWSWNAVLLTVVSASGTLTPSTALSMQHRSPPSKLHMPTTSSKRAAPEPQKSRPAPRHLPQSQNTRRIRTPMTAITYLPSPRPQTGKYVPTRTPSLVKLHPKTFRCTTVCARLHHSAAGLGRDECVVPGKWLADDHNAQASWGAARKKNSRHRQSPIQAQAGYKA